MQKQFIYLYVFDYVKQRMRVFESRMRNCTIF